MSPSATETTAPLVAVIPAAVQTKVTLSEKIIASEYVQSLVLNVSINIVFPVTGANRGIGLGIAECCLVNGAEKIYSIDFADPGDEFQHLAKQYPGRLFAVQADVTKEASVQEAVDKILTEAGGLHGMVCNAGRTNHKSALDFTTEEIEALFNVNVSYFLSRDSNLDF